MPHKSAGAGSPVFFRCPGARYEALWSLYRDEDMRQHDVVLTGRTKPYKPPRALGSRSTFVSREYECQACGHVGWSNHVDLERLERRS